VSAWPCPHVGENGFVELRTDGGECLFARVHDVRRHRSDLVEQCRRARENASGGLGLVGDGEEAGERQTPQAIMSRSPRSRKIR
jgi:hypothetical protein